jgi:PAS domain S-box-containing protein
MMTRILLVDDDPLNLSTLEAILAPEGYEMFCAQDSDRAWEMARELRPDIILLDVMMPGMNGFELCQRLRATPSVREASIIIVTALDDEHSRLKGLECGADDFLAKPLNKGQLRARLRTLASLNRFRQIADQRDRFQSLFELAPAAILLVDLTGHVMAANSRTRGLLAAPESVRLEGSELKEWFDAEAEQRLRSLLALVNQGAAPEASPIVRVERKAGEQILSARATRLAEASGLTLLALDDITTEVRAREALERFNHDLETQVRARTRQLREANALLLSYASFVSHDLRSPLAILKGYLSMLDGGFVPLSEEAAPMIKECFEASKAMEQLIDNVLRLAKEEHAASGARPLVDLLPIVRRVVAHASSCGERRPEVVIHDLPSLRVSPPLIERIFYNLVANAVKHTAHVAKPRIDIGGRHDSGGPILYVRDNGPGFDERQSDRLFREFSRLESDEESDGIGLGLTLVARLLRSHRARMWAEGKLGEGATFYVQFLTDEPRSTNTARG